MLVVHGVWRASGGLALWAEDSTLPAVGKSRRIHPYAVAPDVYGKPGEATFLLPSAGGRPLESPELFREDAPKHRVPKLAPWQVSTVELDADEALEFLLTPPDGAGGTIRHLAEVARYAVDLVARGRVVPTVGGTDDVPLALWRPVLTGEDRPWVQTLLHAMPPVGRTSETGELRHAEEVFAQALDALVDAAARTALPAEDADTWPGALAGTRRAFTATPEQLAKLRHDLDQWARDAAAGSVRAFFRLVEPLDPESDDPWRVELSLQAADEPSLVVPAGDIWESQRGHTALARYLDAPQETFLAELGRAARLWPYLDRALAAARPADLPLDTAEAHAFLRDAAPLLAGAGFGVLLPSWWGKTAARIGARLTAKSPTAPATVANSTSLGLDAMIDYEWQLALGDHTLTEAELKRLAKVKAPLVRVRGQWVELDAKRLAAGLALMATKGQMSVLDLLTGAPAAAAGLPVVDVQASGWVRGLLDGEKIAAVEPSGQFTGVLRPYQQRGLSWLAFLERLGLGAVLADSMGLGKCLSADMRVMVNGALVRADDIWHRYAGVDRLHDGEGEWAEPTESLMVNSIDSDGVIVEAPIRRLYRQHVSEHMRRVRLDDGSEVLITKRHKLLKVDDWTTDVKVGDRLCVPSRIVWKGAPVDPDLVRLLAWQIAEGHERGPGLLRITQKDRSVLDKLLEAVPGLGTRLDIQFNKPSIVAQRNVNVLRINSVEYARMLALMGYEWGRRSAAKTIPDFVVSADDETIRLFLREYFTAEGSVLRTGVVEIASASPILMQQLSMMLRRLGIWLRVRTKMKRATNGSGILRPYQVGLVGGPSLRRFVELVGFSDSVKSSKAEWLCGVAANTNVEGVPGTDLLQAALEVTRLPQRHFGLGAVYFAGTQELSRTTALVAVRAMDRMLSGEAADEYCHQPRTKWTTAVLGAYDHLDRQTVRRIRDVLAHRAASEVHYARVVEIEEVEYTGWVYDFEVEEHHNFVAGGMLCHNTVQLLALLSRENVGPTLLVCPMSLVGNWEREAAKFAPALRVHVHHGAERAQGESFLEAVRGADLVVTTYALAARDAEALSKIQWHRVVVDEAQAIKNAATRQAVAIRSLPARHKIAVTGTPVENRLADLWAIMEFANPGLLGPASEFKRAYAEPIQRQGDQAAAERLRRLTQPFVLRRLKTDKSIISDLPEKLEMEVVCNLTAEQATLYQAIVDDALAAIEGAEGIERKGLVLATMTKLKQVCNHPAQLLRDGSRLAGRSGKLARLEEILEEVLEAGEKALLFSQYAEFGGALQAYLTGRFGREVLFLHGGVAKSGRDEMVQRFQSDDGPPIFVLSLKAGGTGLTLTAANHVIHVDRWWNPAVEDQATDRAFRIGQKRDVQVRKFVCAGTVEERISAMLAEKRELADRIVGTGEGWITELSTDDLRDLFTLDRSAVVE
ncbi:intein/homing endonuclease [Hamadaea flava]|uniref:SNF2-related protein n=1 Tax=Hamadaea flava TaxID=1742688 RepID=A0ABV8LK06_9ACTN|nr:SNF2-related protein [Hamadaea flava]MCP2323756.1 intein/homing endonuclease [Hamadaea flava]